MNQDILSFINSQRIAVLAVGMPDGAPHAATIHFASAPDASRFYFITSVGTKKAEALSKEKTSKASVVVGFDESVMKTLQFDGDIRLIREDELENFKEVYIGKFPEKEKYLGELLVIFAPTWWRYTDFKSSQGKLIITSTDKV